MNQIIINNCTQIDFPHILPLLESHAEVFDFQQKRHILQISQSVLDESPKQPPLFIANHEDRVIAYIGLQSDRNDPNLYSIFAQVVKRGYQGQGIGSKMLEAAIGHVRQLRADRLMVHLKSEYPPVTKHFYQHHQFKPYFDESYQGSSMEDVVMIKQLHTLSPSRVVSTTPESNSSNNTAF